MHVVRCAWLLAAALPLKHAEAGLQSGEAIALPDVRQASSMATIAGFVDRTRLIDCRRAKLRSAL